MATLELGVVEIAYSQTENGQTKSTTTGDVAEILEKNYHVMQYFYESRKEQIANALAEGMGRALEDIMRAKVRNMQGKFSRTSTPMYGAEQKIEAQFRSFLDSNEMQKIALQYTGVYLSQAAAAGVSHRKKHPYAKKNKARAAFVDTGLFRSAFRCTIKL